MLSAPALNQTLEAKTGQKRSGEVGKCAQQRLQFDAGNTVLSWGAHLEAVGLAGKKNPVVGLKQP